jgi:flagellar assembly protein FliH
VKSSSDPHSAVSVDERPLVRPMAAGSGVSAGISAWEMPDFDEPEAEQEAKPRDPQAEALDRARQVAEQAGFAAGQAQGEQAGFAAGHAEGHAQGLAAALAEQTQIQLRFQGWLQSLTQPLADLDAEVSLQLARLAAQMARAIIYRELTIEPEHLEVVARTAIETLPVAARAVTLVCHPDDAEALQAAIDQDQVQSQHVQTITVRRDAGVTPGGLQVESNTVGVESLVDATLEARWAALCLRVLDEQRVAGPADPIVSEAEGSSE